jgi:hypothetical protein
MKGYRPDQLSVAIAQSQSLRSEIDTSFMDIRSALAQTSAGSADLQPYFSPTSALRMGILKYLCVAISSYIESTTRVIFRQFASASSHAYVSEFVAAMFGNLQNAKLDNIYEAAGFFHPSWKTNLQNCIQTSSFAGTPHPIDVLVRLKNGIAHNLTYSVPSFSDIHDYYHEVVRVLLFLENQCGGALPIVTVASPVPIVDQALNCH